jgi:hypothetical protein
LQEGTCKALSRRNCSIVLLFIAIKKRLKHSPSFYSVALPQTSLLLPPSRTQQNEVLRENQFFGWTVNKKNLLGLGMMVLGIPLGYRHLFIIEAEARDVARGAPPRERI